MTGIHPGVEVDDGGSIAVPLAKREVGFPLNLTRWRDDDAIPGVGGTHDVGRFVHHDAGFGLTAPR